MYEMLEMYGSAQVQYDELDAMFTQYVLNANAGGKIKFLFFVISYFQFFLRQVVVNSLQFLLLLNCSSFMASIAFEVC